ncbi:MAG: LysR family transcriptional regulator [Burkholderiales bacterium]|nr:LysR family transcriptional regulator [Burkholderiales bacterium]
MIEKSGVKGMGDLRPAFGNLRLRHLRMLELLGNTGTVRKTAKLLHLSEPAVSQMLKNVEEAFGGPLFIRTRRGLVPNSRFSVLLRRIRGALGELSAADTELAHSDVVHPKLRFGASLHILTHLFAPAIGRLRLDHPDWRFSLQEGSMHVLLNDLAEGNLDCVGGRMLPRNSTAFKMSDFEFWPIYSGELCLVVSVNHPLARRRRVALSELLREDWALSIADGRSRQLLQDAFLMAGFELPEPVVECRPFHVNLAVVSQSRLITVAMRAEALRGQRLGMHRILPVSVELDGPPMAIFFRKSALNDPVIAAVRDVLREVGNELNKTAGVTGRHRGNSHHQRAGPL